MSIKRSRSWTFLDEVEVNEDGETADEAAATAARRERMAKAAALKAAADEKAGKKRSMGGQASYLVHFKSPASSVHILGNQKH